MGPWRIIAAMCLMAAQAEAGAWARGAGTTFVSLSYTLSADPAAIGGSKFDPHGFFSLLVERGLTERLTFGLDAGQSDGGDYRAVAYLSRTFGAPDAENQFAVHLGAGLSRHGGTDDPLAYLGASWGRGFESRWGAGWAALDAHVYYRTNTGAVIAKADLTVGVKPGPKTHVFVQLQTAQYPDSDLTVKAVPSVAYEFGPGRHVEVGVSVGLAGTDDVGVKIGTWLKF